MKDINFCHVEVHALEKLVWTLHYMSKVWLISECGHILPETMTGCTC